MRNTDVRCATQCLTAPRSHAAQVSSNFDRINAFSIVEFIPKYSEVKMFAASPLTDAEYEKLCQAQCCGIHYDDFICTLKCKTPKELYLVYCRAYVQSLGTTAKAQAVRALLDAVGCCGFYSTRVMKLPARARLILPSDILPLPQEALWYVKNRGMLPTFGASIHYPGCSVAGRYSLDPDRAEAFHTGQGASDVKPWWPPSITVCGRALTSGSVEHMVNLAEEVTKAVVATKHSRTQLDKSYVVLMELDAVIASYIMMDKYPAELTEIAVLIQRLVSQSNSAHFNAVFSLATEPGDYDNEPEATAVCMLAEGDEPDCALPAELTVDIRPIINGHKWRGMILDSGCSTSVIIRDSYWIEKLNPDEAIELTTADSTPGKTLLTRGSCQVRVTFPCVPGSAEGPTVRILIESAQHCPSAPNLFPTHVLVSNGFKINLDKDNSHIVTPKGGIIPLVTWNNKVIIPFLPLSEFEQSRGASTASVLPVATSSVAHSTQEQPPALSDVPTLQLWHYRLHKPTKDLKMLPSKTTDMMIAQDSICSGCAEGDLKALRHVASKRPKETQVGALVYSDVFGPYPVYSLNRHRYFVVFLDAASGFLATFFTRSTHSQAIAEALNDFVTLVGHSNIAIFQYHSRTSIAENKVAVTISEVQMRRANLWIHNQRAFYAA